MGFNFRKSFKIAPGVRLNVGKKGISSVSVGGKGVRVSVGKKGTRTTVSAPGTGLSYSTFSPRTKTENTNNLISPPEQSTTSREKIGAVNLFIIVVVIFFLLVFWIF